MSQMTLLIIMDPEKSVENYKALKMYPLSTFIWNRNLQFEWCSLHDV